MVEQRTSHQRTHSLLLLQRLLSLRQGSSPFTLLLDSIEQSSRPVVSEFIKRAKTAGTSVIYVSFETLRPSKNVSHTIKGYKKSLTQLQKDIISSIPASGASLIVLDTIHPLIALQTPQSPLSTFLTSLIPSPQTSLLATFHTSIPLLPTSGSTNPYSPSPVSLLSYLATTIITISSFHHVLAEKRAAEKARAPPLFGLDTGQEGVLLGLGANGGAAESEGGNGIVLRIEHRRKSGRAVGIDAVLFPSTSDGSAKLGLLEEHPLYALKKDLGAPVEGEEGMQSTFNLELTDKQRRDREGVVLPYFDAQKGEGPGEGGRILYQMGEEDLGDWDEEEDEI